MGPRGVAAEVLVRVEKDGAFAAAALDAALDRHASLDRRDRALATELAYGVLRLKSYLEARVRRHAPKGTGSLDPTTRAHLLLAAYQLVALERVPAFAAVSEAVGAIRALRGPRLAGFANAVLRKLAAEGRATREELSLASFDALDGWLRGRLVAAVGEASARALVSLDPTAPPPTCLRVLDEGARADVAARIAAAYPDAEVALGRVSPLAIVTRGLGRTADVPGVAEGDVVAQEEGSQLVALALGAREGERVLDACAGRGNKTAILARAVGASGVVDAADLHEAKLEHLARTLSRGGARAGRMAAVDWSRGVGAFGGAAYDAVLVDAPCSGTGTLRRRPDLAARRSETNLAELTDLQRAIVRQVATLVRPGGRLVYAVCSVLPEELEDVVCELGTLGFSEAPFAGEPARALAGDSARLRLMPDVHDTDGYALASFRRDG